MKKGQQIANIYGCWQQISILNRHKRARRNFSVQSSLFWKKVSYEKCFFGHMRHVASGQIDVATTKMSMAMTQKKKKKLFCFVILA